MSNPRNITALLLSIICMISLGCEQKSTKPSTPSGETTKSQAEKPGKAAGEAVKSGSEAAKSGAEAAKEAGKDLPNEE